MADSQTNPDSSFDSDELFRSASVATNELLSCSSFGSALDVMTDDDRSIATMSSATTLTQRYSSCSERSVKLSDIINRPVRNDLTKVHLLFLGTMDRSCVIHLAYYILRSIKRILPTSPSRYQTLFLRRLPSPIQQNPRQ